ncbi:hypothetical protein CRENBAI_023035 [Crenichthys baileyi]|uniref:Rubisco LSMT substrate-binding domain-containing protein n=1 Tax=Crenichthys baileyi TaxID=28760 RepID=A0AAV9RWE1_9TELE
MWQVRPLGVPQRPLVAGVLYRKQDIQSDSEQQIFDERFQVLCQMMQENRALVFSKQGCLTESELHSALKLLCMTADEFSEFKDNEGWEEDDEDDDKITQIFSNDGLPDLKASWKRLIHEAARLTLRSYGDGELESDRLLMEDQAALKGLSTVVTAVHICFTVLQTACCVLMWELRRSSSALWWLVGILKKLFRHQQEVLGSNPLLFPCRR